MIGKNASNMSLMFLFLPFKKHFLYIFFVLCDCLHEFMCMAVGDQLFWNCSYRRLRPTMCMHWCTCMQVSSVGRLGTTWVSYPGTLLASSDAGLSLAWSSALTLVWLAHKPQPPVPAPSAGICTQPCPAFPWGSGRGETQVLVLLRKALC